VFFVCLFVYQDVEHHYQSDTDIAQEKLDVMQGLLDDEKRKREACEQEIRTHMEVSLCFSFSFCSEKT
jgi:hypothetical protein